MAFLAKCHECHKTMVNERDEQEDKVENTADGYVSKHRAPRRTTKMDLYKNALADIKIFVSKEGFIPLCSHYHSFSLYHCAENQVRKPGRKTGFENRVRSAKIEHKIQ